MKEDLDYVRFKQRKTRRFWDFGMKALMNIVIKMQFRFLFLISLWDFNFF